jgi:uncharacterized protein YbjT (DUF2867 family)
MILITGAGGNVGSEVLKQISQAGQRVRAAYQSLQKAASAPPGVETVIVDFNRPETLRAALDGIDRVFLVGPVAPNLVELESRAIDEIIKAGVQRLVKLSAMGTRAATFPRQHHESEDRIKASGVQWTFLRPNGFMQNMVIYNAATVRGQNAFYGSQGEGRVSHIDVRDVAAAAVRVLLEDHHAGRTYTLTGPEALSQLRIAEILSATLGRPIRYVNLPPEQMKQALLNAGIPEWSASGILDLETLYREGGAAAVTGDVALVLGRQPIVYERFARDYASRLQATEGNTGS